MIFIIFPLVISQSVIWNKRKWREKFDELCKYKDRNGNCLVSVQDKNNKTLASWVSNQRTQYRSRMEGKKASINLNRIHLLNSIGFVWKVNPERKSKISAPVSDKELNDPNHESKEGEVVEHNKHSSLSQSEAPSFSTTASSSSDSSNETQYTTDISEIQFQSTQLINSYETTMQLATESIIGYNTVRQEWKESSLCPFLHVNEQIEHDITWDDMFEKLKEYKHNHGDTLVPREFSEDPALGTWCYNQKQHYKFLQNGGEAELDDHERMNRLKEIDFIWVDVNKEQWNEMFNHWKKYRDKQCELSLPKLRQWISNQRRHFKQYKKGLPSPLTQSMIEQLVASGFEWDQSTADITQLKGNVNRSIYENFETMIEKMKQYRAENNHCLILPTSKTDDSLKEFATLLRKQYKALSQDKPTILTDEKMSLLDELGFVWDIGGNSAKNLKWRSMFEKLASSYKQQGHFELHEPELKVFINEQRVMYQKLQSGKKSSLTSEQIAMLESIGFCWQQSSREDTAEVKSTLNPSSAVKVDEVKQFLVNCKSKINARDNILTESTQIDAAPSLKKQKVVVTMNTAPNIAQV